MVKHVFLFVAYSSCLFFFVLLVGDLLYIAEALGLLGAATWGRHPEEDETIKRCEKWVVSMLCACDFNRTKQ